MAVEAAVAFTVAAEADSTAEAASAVAADSMVVARFVEVAVVSVAAALEARAPMAEVRTAAAAWGAVGPTAEARTAVVRLAERELTAVAQLEAAHPVAPAVIRLGAGPRMGSDAALALVVAQQLAAVPALALA